MIKNIYQYKKWLPIVVFIIFLAILLLPTRSKFSAMLEAGTNQIVSLNLNKNTTSINDNVILNVKLNTLTENVNAVGIKITFDPQVLQIQSVDTSESFCTLYTDRSYSSNKGYVNLFCGKPKPGFTGTNTLETITFKTVSYGKSEISVDPNSLVLKNDGKATNILKNFANTSVSVILSN